MVKEYCSFYHVFEKKRFQLQQSITDCISQRMFLQVYKRFALSANIVRSKRLKAFLSSFLYNRNGKGPNIHPWGTPYFEIGFCCGLCQHFFSCFIESFFIQLQLLPSIPINLSFLSKIACLLQGHNQNFLKGDRNFGSKGKH